MKWTKYDSEGREVIQQPTIPSGAPVGASYLTVTPDAALTSEFALSALGAGLLYNNPGSNPSIATLPQVDGLLPYILLTEHATAGSHAGGFTSGAWRQRPAMLVEDVDTHNICTVVSLLDFTLPAGTYDIRAVAPAQSVDAHQIRLWNVSTSVVVQALNASWNMYGTSGFASAADLGNSFSILCNRFQIGATQTLRIEHRCQTTNAVSGFGRAAGLGGTETYMQIELWKAA